jgi:hypothetical protein
LQVSRVNNFFGCVLDCVLLLFSYLQLLDRLGNQLVGDFGVSGYTRKNMPCMRFTKRYNAMQHAQLEL